MAFFTQACYHGRLSIQILFRALWICLPFLIGCVWRQIQLITAILHAISSSTTSLLLTCIITVVSVTLSFRKLVAYVEGKTWKAPALEISSLPHLM